ncbi:MAG: hypothetical protein LBP26_04550 [Clostridiales bacterium]|jgi:hypothetical protein|nr:hypothetical protein [Clostridiales bacterium]
MRQAANFRNYGKNKRALLRAVLFCVCLLLAALFALSAAYLAAEANHEHDDSGRGGECAGCVLIQAAQNVLKDFSAADAVAASAAAAVFCVIFIIGGIARALNFGTLISLKVRLNN